jgi:multidrug efflux pump subunit AcrB
MSDCVGGRILNELNNPVLPFDACSQKRSEEDEPMNANHKLAMLNHWRFKRWTVCGIALVFFAAGSLITLRLARMTLVRADSNRVFELRVYHAVPGKLPALESRFRDTTSKLLAKHDLKVVAYWVPEGAPAWDNTFIFLVAHSSREEAKKNWDAMRADPAFQEMLKSEEASKMTGKIDVTYMRPTDFSPMK